MKYIARYAALMLVVFALALSILPQTTYALGPEGLITLQDMAQVCDNTWLVSDGNIVPNYDSSLLSTQAVVWYCDGMQYPVFKENGDTYCQEQGYSEMKEVTKKVSKWLFLKRTVRIGYKCE